MTTKIDVLRIKEASIPTTETGYGFFYTTSDTPYFKSGTGVVATEFSWIGENREVDTAQATDYTTDFALSNQHLIENYGHDSSIGGGDYIDD